MKQWDIFVSYASEDRDEVAVPLATLLHQRGLRVWIDRAELRLGDSLRERIDEGLAMSRLGVVILSPSFLRKEWPSRELNGLFAREEAEKNILLPVWHRLRRNELLKYSPMLADRVAITTDNGLEEVARAIVAASDSHQRRLGHAPGVAPRFLELLDSQPITESVLEFLEENAGILRVALGGGPAPFAFPEGHMDTIVRWTWRKRPDGPHALFALWQGTQKTYHCEGIFFGSPREPLFLDDRTPSPELVRWTSAAQRLRDSRGWPGAWLAQAINRVSPGNCHHFTVVASRRAKSGLAPAEMRVLRDFTDHLQNLTVRTYDWLVDAAVRLDRDLAVGKSKP